MNLIINVASKNQIKVEAVREITINYDLLKGAVIRSLSAQSEVSEEPRSLEETIRGAINRAMNSFNACDLSFGIESGLIEVPNTKTGYMDVCACAIYDGEEHCLGLSSAFEFPIEVTSRIFEEDIDANDAFYRAGLTESRKIGSEEGAIGMLTKGRVTRKDYTKQAIIMAMIQLENSELYKV